MSESLNPSFESESLAGDPRRLAEQLGSADELTSLSPSAFSAQLGEVHSVGDLQRFLKRYREEILGPLEFRCIYQAYNHAQGNELRELLALDAKIAAEQPAKEIAGASLRVGQRQLNRMRPLKDNRLVQRYRQAVADGKAQGWHTLVYGLVLAGYSIPLRQGLLHYGRQTVGGFIEAAARRLALRERASQQIQDETVLALPGLIEQTISLNGSPLKIVS